MNIMNSFNYSNYHNLYFQKHINIRFNPIYNKIYENHNNKKKCTVFQSIDRAKYLESISNYDILITCIRAYKIF
jgi:hypothetical protein